MDVRPLYKQNVDFATALFHPKGQLTAFHTLITGVRDHGCALPLQRATFQLFSACTLDPLRTPAAAPPRANR